MNFKRKCKAPAGDRGHLLGWVKKGDRTDSRLQGYMWWGEDQHWKLMGGGVRGRIRPVRNFQVKSHLAHGGRDSTAIPPLYK